MSRSIQFCLFFFLLLPASKSLAQNTMTKKVDSLYREDQFFIGVTYNLVTNVPGDVNIRGLSGGFQFGYLRDMPINKKRTFAIAIGAGLSFDRYGQTLFIGETDSEQTVFTILTDDIDYDTNRFSTATIEAPLEFRWRTSTPESYKFWRIHAGFRVGYAYWYQATFKQPNNNVTQTSISEFDRVRLGATLAFGYNTFNFYAYYSINPFFTDAVTTNGQTVDFRTLKIGLLFYIL
jgi:hypothetical protein